MKHDLVYTWVNSHDEQLSALRARYSAAEVKEQFEYRAGAARYRDNGELKKSILGALRFLPDLGRIHVAHAGQPPAWAAEFPNVNFVNQSAVVPEAVFPTFQSDAIEAFLHRIPELSEHYVYANDDFFFAKQEPFSSFYDSQGRALMGVSPRIAGTPRRLEPVFRQIEINSVRALKKVPSGPLVKEGKAIRGLLAAVKARVLCAASGIGAVNTLSHVAQPHIRSAWGGFSRLFQAEIEKLCSHKFRSAEGYAINFMYAHYLRSVGRAKFIEAPLHAYIDPFASPAEKSVFLANLTGGLISRFCLNDVPSTNDESWRAFVQTILQDTYLHL